MHFKIKGLCIKKDPEKSNTKKEVIEGMKRAKTREPGQK